MLTATASRSPAHVPGSWLRAVTVKPLPNDLHKDSTLLKSPHQSLFSLMATHVRIKAVDLSATTPSKTCPRALLPRFSHPARALRILILTTMGPIRMGSVGRKRLIVVWDRRALHLFDSRVREDWMMLPRGRIGLGADIAARKGEWNVLGFI